jgi:RNA 2',3'-cyclic 3'-phosphodiesterase
MKPHRIFIAINLPEETKEQLLAYKDKWPEVPARWTTKDNLHVTLAFLGNTSDQELAEVCELMQGVGLPADEAGERYKPFSVNISHITYGPNSNQPKMIWAKIKTTNRLLNLQKDIERTLGQHDSKPFAPHLTLARLKAFELQHMELEEIPEINEKISLSFTVQSIEVMESSLKRSGPTYTIFQSVPLTEN